MISKKKFFFDKNRLNKGYLEKKCDNKIDKNSPKISESIGKYRDLLPDPNVIAEYEKLHPGILRDLLEIAKKEQKHKHDLDILKMKQRGKFMSFGRTFSLLFLSLLISFILLFFLFHDSFKIFITFTIVVIFTFVIFWFILVKLRINTMRVFKNVHLINKGKNNVK